MESRGRAWLGGGGAWAGAARDASRAGGWGMLTDTRIAAPRQRAQRRSEPSGDGDPPPPRHGESNPDPQRACSPGEPSWRVVQKLAAAQEGHSALPTPHKNSAQSEGERRLYRAIAEDGELAGRSMPWGWAIAQSRIVREQDEPHRPQNLLKKRAPGGCAVIALGKD